MCILSTDGMCPFKDKTKISLWPVILIIMNLPEAMRYDPRNIIILYIAASAAGGQPKNFHSHLSMVVDELIDSAAGYDMLVGGLKTRVHVVVPVLSADGRGPPILCDRCQCCQWVSMHMCRRCGRGVVNRSWGVRIQHSRRRPGKATEPHCWWHREGWLQRLYDVG